MRRGERKGFFFSLDALLASALLITGLILITQVPPKEPELEHIDYISKDILTALGSLRVEELNLPAGTLLVTPEPNNTILEQIGEYWATNNMADAITLGEFVLNETIPRGIGFNLSYGGETIYYKTPISNVNRTQIVASRRMLSGIADDKPLSGSSSSAYLRHITDKRTSSYIYFGGFVGQGALGFHMDDLPLDVRNETIEEMWWEVDAERNMSLQINGEVCLPNVSAPSQIYWSPNPLPMVIDRFNITHCKDYIKQAERNWFNITFSGGTTYINESYLAGGYIKITYRTDEFQTNVSYGKIRYWFPGIKGIANLYDSFYVPGTLTNMTLHLIYNSSQTSYVTIGSREAWNGNSSGAIATVDLNDTYFLDMISMDYEALSNQTIPLRFASFNNSETTIPSGGNADVVIITDFSGSMKKELDPITEQGSQDWGLWSCTPPPDDDTRRQNLALCLDKQAIEILLNSTNGTSGNRVWNVFTDAQTPTDTRWRWVPDSALQSPYSLVDVRNDLGSEFPSQGKGKTCLGCALNLAYDILKNHTLPGRKKFIIFMTDGLPTHNVSNTAFGYGNNSIAENQVCDGWCDTGGQHSCDGGFTGGYAGCTIPGICDYAIQQTNYSARRLQNDQNVTIFTIGFGNIDLCPASNSLLDYIAYYSNGTYQHSDDYEDLLLIYQNISRTILSQVTTSSQTVTLQGFLQSSQIFPDSYLDLTYIPYEPPVQPNQISLSFQTPTFPTCPAVYNIETGVRPYDVKFLSYSGIHWTDYVASNGITVFNLSEFYLPYARLGDPYVVHVPYETLLSGNNIINFSTGDMPNNTTNCSGNNSIVYIGFFNSSTSRSTVLPKALGCNWTVEFEDGSFSKFIIPSAPVPTKTCNYTYAAANDVNPPFTGYYDQDDAYDYAVFNIFKQLDFDNDGRVLVNINREDLEIIVVLVNRVPYLWGPSFAEAQAWQ
jgi:hypothetical protein